MPRLYKRPRIIMSSPTDATPLRKRLITPLEFLKAVHTKKLFTVIHCSCASCIVYITELQSLLQNSWHVNIAQVQMIRQHATRRYVMLRQPCNFSHTVMISSVEVLISLTRNPVISPWNNPLATYGSGFCGGGFFATNSLTSVKIMIWFWWDSSQ